MEYGSKSPDELSSESPNKRFKTQNNQENSPPRPPSPSQSGSNLSFLKGKSKLGPEKETIICGICLSEAVDEDGTGAYRGYIDSCNHYFCFVCIMIWAKIESKCPMCKRRFFTITRPSKPPTFPRELVVHVPLRDQGDYRYGNASAGPYDPYSNVQCTVCHSSADENFLLLCDLCDSASHTYCVGLGATVPEGDWFCQDCTLLRAEHSESQLDAESKELGNSGNVHGSSEDITVLDVLRASESPVRRVERSCEHTQSELAIESSELSNSRNLDGSANCSPENVTVFDFAGGPEPPTKAVEISSEHTQIEIHIESSELRDSGYPSSSPRNLTVFDTVRDHESPAISVERSFGHTQSELDIESSELSNPGSPNSSPRNITVFDIVRGPESPIRRVVSSSTSNLSNDRIGMDRRGQANNVQDSSRLSARTLQQRRNVLDRIQALRDNWNSLRSGSLKFSSTSSSCTNRTGEVAGAQPRSTSSMHEKLNSENGPLVPTENRSFHEMDKAWKLMHMAKSLEQKCGRKSIPNQESPLRSKHHSTSDQLLRSVNLASIREEKQSPHQNLVTNSYKHRTQILDKQSLQVQRFQSYSSGFPISSSSAYSMLTSSQDTNSPFQNDFCSGDGRNFPEKTEAVRVLSASSNQCRSLSLSSSSGSTIVSSNLSHAKIMVPASSSCNIVPPKCKDKGAKEKNPIEHKSQGTNDAKSEIQSLVKLNLKLLTKDKHLGVNEFKEVAWSATHSILAACGLEHPKRGIRLFPNCACSHASDSLDFRRSTLMPNACRECFYAFVKDVVNTILLHKVEGANVS